jgi:hypothetical protein
VCDHAPDLAVRQIIEKRPRTILEKPMTKENGGTEVSGKDRGTDSKESKRVRRSFGEGNEGVFVQPAKEAKQVLVVGRDIPWWGMVVARLNLRIHSILLSEMRFSSVIRDYFGTSIPLRTVGQQGVSTIQEIREGLNTCTVVAVETLPASKEVLAEMWAMPYIKLVLVAHGRLIEPPPGGALKRRRVTHSSIGGVTDAVSYLGIYVRCRNPQIGIKLKSIAKSFRPRRDRRSVLKMAISGNRCGPPTKEVKESSEPVGTEVRAVRHGVIFNSGLLNITTKGGLLRLPRVKTIFGGNLWVIRSLTPGEVLSCWDVPEKLGLLVESEEVKRALMHGMFTPLKIWQAVLEDLAVELNKVIMAEDDTSEFQTRTINTRWVKRGPLLKLTSPAEEKEVFDNKEELEFARR